MLDVPGPGLAPDLDDDPRRDVPQLDPDDGREVVHLVEVGIVVSREPLPRCVGDPSHVLLVGQGLPLAGGPDHPQLGAPLLLLPPPACTVPGPGLQDVSLQLGRHLLQGHYLVRDSLLKTYFLMRILTIKGCRSVQLISVSGVGSLRKTDLRDVVVVFRLPTVHLSPGFKWIFL